MSLRGHCTGELFVLFCWFYGPRIISAALNVVFWLFFLPKLAAWFVTPNVSATLEQIWREKMSEKPHSIRLLGWFNLSQSGSRKTIEKPLKELLWDQQICIALMITSLHCIAEMCAYLGKRKSSEIDNPRLHYKIAWQRCLCVCSHGVKIF